MLEQAQTKREYLSTPQAAEQSGLSTNYIATLLRQEKLEGFQLGRDRFVYSDSLEKFLANPRKSGPKGSRKKTSKQTNTQKQTG